MMPDRIVEYHEPVTLLGGGAADPVRLRAALERAPMLVAADGGANMAVAEGLIPDLVIGDFDSVSAEALAAVPAARHLRVPDQDTTDFEKCLQRIRAPMIFGLGFSGPRVDHALAVCGALVRYPERRCLLLGDEDVIFAAPPRLVLDLAEGTRLSLFPMGRVTGQSRGLRWPIGGLSFAPDGLTGTSNEALGPVEMAFDAPGMLVILPIGCLEAAVTALRSAPG